MDILSQMLLPSLNDYLITPRSLRVFIQLLITVYRSLLAAATRLNRIHKCFLHPAENDNANNEE